MRFLRAVVAGIPLLLARPALAQERGTFELGAYARYSVLDDGLPAYNAVGLGGRVGLFVRQNLALELEHARTIPAWSAQGDAVTLDPFYARLAWHTPFFAGWDMILAGGLVRERDAIATGGSYSNTGFSLLGGLQHALSQSLAARLDLVGDAVLSSSGPPLNNAKTGNMSLQAGLTYRLGQGSKDGDKDGIGDALDACPGTLAGEKVDARGCVLPKDGDHDGVIDADDRCPTSPTASVVDPTGCAPDADADGVADIVDRCAGTPRGTQVDGNGCPIRVDTDRDGVIDSADTCANTPAGTRVDARGCPVPLDSDGDSVVDANDACPGTPAGTRVDTRGCAVDADNDGVLDTVDACPGTPAGTTVDGRGCAVVFETGKTTLVLRGVTFASGKAELTPDGMTVLDLVAASLVNAADVNVEVQGHTDNTGSRELNIRLSGQRAETVRQYLVAKGVAANRLTARGYGPDQPVAPNATPAGRQENRRVELKRTN